ncbi:MAG: DoxX family membrane protein [Candidatus Paceibacterota bacterium]|jgi:uncharacterized membrane protein YphA (DoxX/SURF4 family)
MTPLFFLIGKVLFGGFFVISGYNHLSKITALSGYAKSKGVKYPHLSVFFSGLMILLGGLGVIFSIMPVLSLWLIIIFLIVVTFSMHRFWEIDEPMQKMGETINFKKNLALLGAALMMLSLATPWQSVLF